MNDPIKPEDALDASAQVASAVGFTDPTVISWMAGLMLAVDEAATGSCRCVPCQRLRELKDFAEGYRL